MATILPARMPGPASGWHTVGPMGRHVDAADPALDLRRIAQLSGLVGGIAWVAAYFLSSGSTAASAVLWIGGLLLTVALFGLGLMLVKSAFLLLRVFVAIALPTLVWGVFALVLDGASDRSLVEAVFGAAVGLISGFQLTRRRHEPTEPIEPL